MTPPEIAWNGRAILGEGPVWSTRLGAVLFVDIVGASLNVWRPDGTDRSWQLDEAPCWVIERAGEGFVLGLRSRIVELDLDLDGAPVLGRELCRPAPAGSGNRLNDAKATPSGHILFGTMNEAETAATGRLHRLEPDGGFTVVDQGITVANGPAVSLDGATLYHADSPTGIVYAYDLDEQAMPTNRRVHLRFAPEDGFPDGMTVDAENHLWVAHWDGGRISRFRPDGRLERSIALPASRITSMCFVGPAYDRLAVTSAALDRADEPMAGKLFLVDPGVAGPPPARWGF